MQYYIHVNKNALNPCLSHVTVTSIYKVMRHRTCKDRQRCHSHRILYVLNINRNSLGPWLTHVTSIYKVMRRRICKARQWWHSHRIPYLLHINRNSHDPWLTHVTSNHTSMIHRICKAQQKWHSYHIMYVVCDIGRYRTVHKRRKTVLHFRTGHMACLPLFASRFLNVVIVFYSVEKRFYSVENLVQKPVGEQDKTHEFSL